MKKKIFIILFLLIIIFNNGFSSEGDEIYNFLNNILNDLYCVREFCVTYYSGVYTNEDLQIIENEAKSILFNISILIRDNIILFENNEALNKILIIIDYEVNNFLNLEFINNSYEVINKTDVIIEIILMGMIIYSYDFIINDYKI